MKKFGGLNIGQFPDRLILQKRIYLLQLFGLDLGYRYNWYAHGPYCPRLAEEAFKLAENLDDFNRQSSYYKLSPKAMKQLNKYIGFENQLGNQDKDRLLELAASIHFIKHFGYLSNGVSKDNISKVLHKRGKFFEESQINRIWNLLDSVNLIKRKEC